MKNIIDLWNENNNNLPINVARRNWRVDGYAEVVSIEEIGVGRKKSYKVLAKVHGDIDKINNNFTLIENGLYKVNRYDYKNWYIIKK